MELIPQNCLTLFSSIPFNKDWLDNQNQNGLFFGHYNTFQTPTSLMKNSLSIYFTLLPSKITTFHNNLGRRTLNLHENVSKPTIPIFSFYFNTNLEEST
jgi:hypothetical protein